MADDGLRDGGILTRRSTCVSRLPWADSCREVAVGQQVFERLHVEQHGILRLRELGRVVRPGGHLWLAVPNMRKICKAYVDLTLNDLLQWALVKGGWGHVEESTEAALIAVHQWPPRNDNESSLYVRAT